MIKILDVDKSFGRFAINNVSLELQSGYLYGIVGRNGAGKTTLLNMLLGLIKPDSGELTIDGLNYQENEKEIHDIFSEVLVDELLDSTLSVSENGRFYGALYSGFDLQQYLNLCDSFDLDINKHFGKLSKGQKLKCQFAFALACNSKYLILDEPTANFDPEFRRKFFEAIREYMKNGENTVIMATHLTDDLDREADYLIFMDKGSVVFSGDIETFRDSYRIVAGEKYKLKLIDSSKMIYLEEREYGGAKALVKHKKHDNYDSEIKSASPTIEEFMYFYCKGEER